MKYIFRTSWGEQKENIKKVNPDLFRVVEDLDLGNDLPLYRAIYPYGSKLLHKGKLQIINNDRRGVSLCDSSVDLQIQKDLEYAPTLPMGVLLEKRIELYSISNDHTAPFVVFRPGSIFALSVVLNTELTLDKGDFWEASSGIRTSFSTMKLSYKKHLAYLEKKIGKNLVTPKTYYDHIGLFSAISEEMGSSWNTDVIYFTKDWLQERNDLKWKAFKCYLYDYNWKAMQYSRQQNLHDLVYSRIVGSCKNISHNLFVNNIVKHLIGVSNGYKPAFCIVDNNEGMPFDLIRETIIDIYDSEEQYPVFVTVDSLPHLGESSVYYSLAAPTCQELLTPRVKSVRKTQDIEEIMRLVKALKEKFSENFQFLEGRQYDLMRSFSECSIIEHHTTHKNSYTSMIKHDEKLIKSEKNAKERNLSLQLNNPFFNGVIQISRH